MRFFTNEQVGMVAHRARALSDQTRVKILEVLARSEQPVGQIAAAISSQPSTVSKHLQVLFLAGLVRRRRSASTVIYWIADPALLDWCRYLGAPQVKGRRSRA